MSDLLVKAVDGGVREIFINEERIDKEIQALTASIMRFSKQNDQWLAASHALNTAVKVGDQNCFFLRFLPRSLLYQLTKQCRNSVVIAMWLLIVADYL